MLEDGEELDVGAKTGDRGTCVEGEGVERRRESLSRCSSESGCDSRQGRRL